MTIKTLIVDDEPLARTGLSDYLHRVDFLTEAGQARDGMEALRLIESLQIDLLLLDVQMPGLSGTELMQSLRHPPAVIFTTAHPGFAVEGFELNAIDYLLKPISFPRFLRAALKARDKLSPESLTASSTATAPASAPNKEEPEDIFIRQEGRVERLLLKDILYAESMQNYCRIHTVNGSHLPLLPLKELIQALPEADFFQIHRSYVVNLKAVEAIVGNQLRIGPQLLPVSRSKRAELERRLVGNRLL
ncbi:LytR/AlgR family response regulator transcription factor [Neolewinella agarilytica]|uniref:LytR/AlgR family response regulator transcription factor n=1 Tax=Neolewinella agarilytica TaxID=478744 RepID=UPI00235649EE|nr:LytTR family DNA-binding domain-containing protein [Neolewinella agarilytica]